MVRPTAESKKIDEMRKYLGRGRPLRVAAVFLTLAQKGHTMRFKEIWDSPLVRDNISSKSVLHETLEYMRRSGFIEIERKGPKMTKVTLLTKLPDILSKEVDNILFNTAELESTSKRVASNIERGRISSEEVSKLVSGMFIHNERDRLDYTIKLLEVYRDPILWPYMWSQLIHSLVVIPLIFNLQILRACEEKYPEATNAALRALYTSISKVLHSEQFKDYQRIYDSLSI